MPRSLSMDLRSRVIQDVNEGASRQEAAARFGVSAARAGAGARDCETRATLRPGRGAEIGSLIGSRRTLG
jgi:transposase